MGCSGVWPLAEGGRALRDEKGGRGGGEVFFFRRRKGGEEEIELVELEEVEKIWKEKGPR